MSGAVLDYEEILNRSATTDREARIHKLIAELESDPAFVEADAAVEAILASDEPLPALDLQELPTALGIYDE